MEIFTEKTYINNTWSKLEEKGKENWKKKEDMIAAIFKINITDQNF